MTLGPVIAEYLAVVGPFEAQIRGLGMFLICFVAAARLHRMLQPGSDLYERIAEELRGPLARWSPWLLRVMGVLVGLDLANVLPVTELVTLVYTALNFPLLVITGTTVTPVTVLIIVAVLLLARRASGVAQTTLGTMLRRQGDVHEGVIASLQRLLHYGVLVLAAAFALQTAGFNLSALFAASAVLGVGIAFGLQNLSENFVSGLILLFERSIHPGDMLSVDGRVVRVEQMGIRSTTCLSMDDEELIVPNALLVSGVVVNHTTGVPDVRARVQVGVAYESDVDEVIELLAGAARGLDARAERTPVVHLVEFADSSIVFEVSVWSVTAFTRPQLMSDLRVAIWRTLTAANIEIAFPQLDVHLKTESA